MNTLDQKKPTPVLTSSSIRQWAKTLAIKDVGKVTREIYFYMGNLKTNLISPQTRIEITEIIRPQAERALENLEKKLSDSTFPLSERNKSLFSLNQSLLLEMAGAYQLSALDILTKGIKNKKLLLLSIGRTLHYMGRVLINNHGLYIKPKKALWRDIHHLYLIACENDIQNLKIPEKTTIDYENICETIELYYKKISLLSLSHPHSNRAGEIGRLNRFYRKVLNYVDIYSDPSTTEGKYAHIAMLNSDSAPTLMPVAELLYSPTVRLFDLSKVLKILTEFCKETENTSLGSNDTFPMLNHSLAKRLIIALTTVQNRRFKRFPRNESTTLISHLRNITEVLKSDNKNNNLEESADDLFHELTFGDLNATTWNTPEPIIQEKVDIELRVWKIQNSCSEGYGLLWENDDPSGVRVGEIIAIQDPKDDTHKWQIGAIRWMEFTPKVGLSIGIELLSPSAIPITIKSVKNRTIPQKLPIQGLLLPIIEGLKEKPYLVLPDYIFNLGDIIEIEKGKDIEHLEVTRINNSLGAFSICEYIGSKKEEEQEDIDTYNDIWEIL
ncbi:MAG: hypothetical protein KAH22_11485 [Thiotrichaceae bacterium]|nr:hypothetical protein [Thiotrichaceae bacterium]